MQSPTGDSRARHRSLQACRNSPSAPQSKLYWHPRCADMTHYSTGFRTLAMLAGLVVAVAAWAQDRAPQTTEGSRDVPAATEHASDPEPHSRADNQEPGRNVWSTPLSGIAGTLGLTALFEGTGMNESVAAALSGALLAIVIVALALVVWQLDRKSVV